ncbi:MAG: hypothetical protein M1831_001883 [Alyxoria varia]|nr:MAG: hypothetical protein M1831_001883 [Alyxoria varia]
MSRKPNTMPSRGKKGPPRSNDIRQETNPALHDPFSHYASQTVDREGMSKGQDLCSTKTGYPAPEAKAPKPTSPRNIVAESTPSPNEAEDGTILIDPNGSVCLEIHTTEDKDKEVILFRVNAATLANKSAHFKRLLEDSRFREGAEIASKHAELQSKYGSPSDAPINELPRVKIIDIGSVSVRNSCRSLLVDFLTMLHDYKSVVTRELPLANLANLGVVADRFDALTPIGEIFRSKGQISKQRLERMCGEENDYRQGLLVGVLFNDSHWVYEYSTRLILMGSEAWRSEDSRNYGMWWDLPHGIEEELESRRRYILNTISCLIGDVIENTNAPGRRCTQEQCEYFQLGKFIDHLQRHGLLNVRQAFLGLDAGVLAGSEAHSWQDWDIKNLIQTLCDFQQHQIDESHKLCGPRSYLQQCLEYISYHLTPHGIGICIDCWNAQPHPSRLPKWSEAKPSLLFRTGEDLYFWERTTRHEGHPEILAKAQGKHYSACEFFTAAERNYNHMRIFTRRCEYAFN